jgi:putative two-component system response regulator
MKRLLEEHGFVVTAARTLAQAVAALRGTVYDVVLLDVVLPDGSGLDLLATIAPLAPTTVAMALTGVQDLHTAAEALDRGAFDYLRQPLSADLLLLAVRRALRHRRFLLETDRHCTRLEQLLTSQERERDETDRRLAHTQATIYRVAGMVAECSSVGGASHLTRVGLIAHHIAAQLPGWYLTAHAQDASFVERIAEAAYLHDIGHIALPEGVVHKPGLLTPDEFEIVKRHPLLGREMLETMRGCVDAGGLPTLDLAMQVCATHHERLDGSGYPAGLRGDDLPLAARVVGLADFYDSVTSWRPYRDRAATHAEALELVQADHRSLFDPVVITALGGASAAVCETRRQVPDPGVRTTAP